MVKKIYYIVLSSMIIIGVSLCYDISQYSKIKMNLIDISQESDYLISKNGKIDEDLQFNFENTYTNLPESFYSEINLVSMLALLVLSYMIVFNIGIILSSMKKKIIDENNLSYIKKIATYFLICFSITLLSNIILGIITKVNIELDFKSLFEALITMFIYYIYKYVCTKKDLKD